MHWPLGGPRRRAGWRCSSGVGPAGQHGIGLQLQPQRSRLARHRRHPPTRIQRQIELHADQSRLAAIGCQLRLVAHAMRGHQVHGGQVPGARAFDFLRRNLAHQLVQEIGYEQASAVFHDPQGGFVDRDLYVFVFDRQGVYRVMGADRKRVGSSLFDAPGVDAQQLLDDAWHRCDQGGGWVEYNIINLATGTVKGKSSYVLPLTDDLLIGCGAYRSALTDADNSIDR